MKHVGVILTGKLSLNNEGSLHLLVVVTADGIARKRKSTGLVGLEGDENDLARLNTVGYIYPQIFKAKAVNHVTAFKF